MRPIWESLYNHYVKRRGLDAPYVSEMAAKVRPEGGGGDYGTGGGLDHLGFGTLTFTRDKAIVSATTPTPSASTSASGSSSGTGAATPATDSSGGTQPQGGRGEDLAATGAGGIAAVAATGVLAIAGGFIALRRRGSRSSG